ncbi:hypothetical protein O181_062405 [Austropuccinia psidii MF-1]|uniref:Uncharacterized protein n=1 Tax=Austropuccinia psidii MF-1 TaxID=1389203 RepID=A0A9Q3EGX5_9BASI|nr:hypothetical protein [Austropuccinia psidii MF-1]
MEGSLARLGFSVWSSNLAQNHEDLYNIACRIFCVTTFQQLAVAGAYNNYSMHFSYIMKTGISQRAYDHFVHDHMKGICDKENNSPGSFKAESAKGTSNKNISRAFAILHKFPKRYRRIIDAIGAHSNDEEDTKN